MSEELDLALFYEGDERTFSSLVRAYSPRLLPYLRQYARDSSHAYDLLQDVWLRAYAKRHHFRGEGSLLGWLFAIARNIGIRAAAQEGRDVALLPHHPTVSRDEDARIDRDREHHRIRAAVADLPERQRDIVLLRLVEERPIAEVARLLHCAPGTVKATLHQAIRKLRRQLAPNQTGIL